MKKRLIVTGAGNIIDAISTVILFDRGFYETNPVMRHLLQWPFLFVSVKILAMTVALLILWKNREHKAAQIISWCAAVLYAAIAIYYGVFFTIWF